MIVKSERLTCLRGLAERPSITKPKLKILSIDGGGILGLVPAIILTEIERRVGKPIN